MKAAIAGAGNVGTHIANDLAEAGHEVLLLEQDPDVAARLRLADGVKVVVADACEPTLLTEAGLETCDVMVAVTGDDEDNLVISLLAKQVFAVARVVARVNHPNNQWLFNETWGVDIAVSTPHLLTALVEEAVSVGSLVRLLQFEDARLVEVTLAADSPAENRAIMRAGRASRRHHRGRHPGAPRDRAPRRDGVRGRRRGAGAGDPRVRGGGQDALRRRCGGWDYRSS